MPELCVRCGEEANKDGQPLPLTVTDAMSQYCGQICYPCWHTITADSTMAT